MYCDFTALYKQLTNNALELFVVVLVAAWSTLARTGAEGANAASLPHPDGAAGMHLHVFGAIGDATGTTEHAVLATGMTLEEWRGIVDIGTANEPGRGFVVVSADLAGSVRRSVIVVVVAGGGRCDVLCLLFRRTVPAEGISTNIGAMWTGVACAAQLGGELVDGRERRRGGFRNIVGSGEICDMGRGRGRLLVERRRFRSSVVILALLRPQDIVKDAQSWRRIGLCGHGRGMFFLVVVKRTFLARCR